VNRAAAVTGATHPQDRRQSVLIVAFENVGGDAASEMPCRRGHSPGDGSAGQDPHRSVIAGARAASYHDRPVALGREHDVHFVLTGKARHREGRLIRVR
jgi:TolB-like protein